MGSYGAASLLCRLPSIGLASDGSGSGGPLMHCRPGQLGQSLVVQVVRCSARAAASGQSLAARGP